MFVKKLITCYRSALAIRIDLSRDSPKGDAGRKLRAEVDKKIEKMQEPPPGKNVKALPVPDVGPRARRAGKRFAFLLFKGDANSDSGSVDSVKNLQ